MTRSHLRRTLLAAAVLALSALGCASRPPIRASYRESIVGKGLVLRLENTSCRYLRVAVALKNPTTGQSLRRTLDLGPRDMDEIGWLQGWQVMSGDEIAVSHHDYRTLRLHTP
jgi:hypothetical protein